MPKRRYVVRKRHGKWWLILNDRWHACRDWQHAHTLISNLERLGLHFDPPRR